MNTLLQDLKFSLRLLAKTPGFTLTAIAVLALGIGVNTAIFSIVYELAFSPRPFAQPAQVVQLYSHDRKDPKKFRQFSYPVYREIAVRGDIFSGVLAHNLAMVGVGEEGQVRRTFVGVVSDDYFSVLGVPLVRGRAFTAAESRPGSAAPVAIASYLFWEKSGFDPGLVGRTIKVNERAFTIVGITPKNFTGTMMLLGPELYFPLGMFDILSNDFTAEARRSLERTDSYNLFLVARLKPGVTRAAATSALDALGTSLERQFPVEQKNQTFTLDELPRMSTSTSPSQEGGVRTFALLLIGMAGIVLVIACLNLANMLLARSAARRKEFAIRLALGGGRARLVRQLLTEGLVLSFAGGIFGLLLAVWSADLLVGSLAQLLPVSIFFQGAANPAIFVATLAFCLLATLFFALGPALKLSRADVLTDLKEQAGEDAAPRRRRWLPRHPLVVAQIALSLALLICAGLFIRVAQKAASIDTGLKADDTIVVEVDASLGGYAEAQTLNLYNSTAARLGALPGVQSAAIGATIPFGMISLSRPVQRSGAKVAPDAKPATAAEGLAFESRWNSIGADYFAAMGLPVLRGRPFTRAEAEAKGGPAVAIIDEALAKKLWPEGDALGQHIQIADRDASTVSSEGHGGASVSDEAAAKPGDAKSIEIVGIVPVVREDLFEKKPGQAIYVPFAQGFTSNVYFHVRPAVGVAPATLLEAVRREVRAGAPGVPVFNVHTFREHVNRSDNTWIVRIGATLFGVFGGLALVLAVVGLHGVKSYSVSRRTREIGIRMALGAEPGNVQGMIMREGLSMTLLGIALGLLLGAALGQAFGSALTDVSPLDPYAFTIASVVLAGTAMVACYLPARKATRVNPLKALRSE